MPDELTAIINQMIKSGDLNPEDETKLMLAQITITNSRLGTLETQLHTITQQLSDIQKTQTSHTQLNDRVDALEEIHEHYPSLPWLAVNQTKVFFLGLTLFVVLILVIGTPWNVSDIRYLVLDFVGIDPTLGITP